MERESRLFNFPPDPDDLQAPARTLLSAAKQVDAAVMKLGELRDYARKFPVNGSERSAAEVYRKLMKLSEQYLQVFKTLHKLSEETLEVEGDIIAAYHDPQGVGDSAGLVAVASTKVPADDPRWRR